MLDLVNTLQGTDSKYELSYGNTLPLAATPWGMTNWAPQTTAAWGWWFQYGGTEIRGLRATRQPSPWMGDYGQFLLLPQTGPLVTDPDARASPYGRDASTFRPDYLKLDLPKYDVAVELTPSDRCAVLRMTFRSGDVGRLIVDPAGGAEGSHVEFDGRTVRGWSTAASGDAAPPNFRAYFVIVLDRDVTASGTFPGSDKDFVRSGGGSHGVGTAGYAEFATGGDRTVVARVATSYVSHEQAMLNLERETAGGFDAVRTRTAAAWDAHLAKVDVEGGTDDQRRTFYSCLYRAGLFPHRMHEVNAAGQDVHYSPYDGRVHPGVAYTDNGFWDTYRTNYPFWSILYPERLGEILNGFVQSYRENGWFPQWPSPGNRVSMIGTHADAVYADAVAKGITGFDVNAAYEGLRKDAFVVPPPGSVGRQGLAHYLAHGYVPLGQTSYATSCSLDYAYDDWCVARVAKALGKTDDYELLMRRSKNYRASWDPAVGFFRPRTAEGAWVEPFDEFAWGGPFVEGSAWQNAWAVQHDVDGLADLLGGRRAMADKLDRLFGLPPAFATGAYGQVIHEMTEMAQARFGQCALSNQPSHHIPYLYAAIGQPWKTQYWTRRLCQELYNPGPRGFPGDEDNGEMATWFLLSSAGFYPLCVGDPTYTLTSPLFERMTFHLSGGKTFTVRTVGNGEHAVYVKGRTLNGQPFDGTTIPHATVVAGGELVAEMSTVPTR